MYLIPAYLDFNKTLIIGKVIATMNDNIDDFRQNKRRKASNITSNDSFSCKIYFQGKTYLISSFFVHRPLCSNDFTFIPSQYFHDIWRCILENNGILKHIGNNNIEKCGIVNIILSGDNWQGCYLLNIPEPIRQVVERFQASDVIHDEDTHGSPVICRGQGSKSLLPGRVPYLQFYGNSIQIDNLLFKIDPWTNKKNQADTLLFWQFSIDKRLHA